MPVRTAHSSCAEGEALTKHLCAGADSILADRRIIISAITLIVIMPLCFPRELGALAWVSIAAVRAAITPSFLIVCSCVSVDTHFCHSCI